MAALSPIGQMVLGTPGVTTAESEEQRKKRLQSLQAQQSSLSRSLGAGLNLSPAGLALVGTGM